MDIASAISSSVEALRLGKELYNISKSYEDAEHRSKMAELYVAVGELKVALSDAEALMREKDNDILALKEKLRFSGELVVRGNFEFDSDNSGNPKGFAYCPRCEEVDSIFLKVVTLNLGQNICPNCKTEYQAEETNIDYVDQRIKGASWGAEIEDPID